MAFSSFQNDGATLNRYSLDFSGSLSLDQAIPVQADVQYRNSRSLNSEGEEIVTSADVFVTPNPVLDGLSIELLTKSTWKLDYEGVETMVATLKRVRYPGKDKISHYELKLL